MKTLGGHPREGEENWDRRTGNNLEGVRLRESRDPIAEGRWPMRRETTESAGLHEKLNQKEVPVRLGYPTSQEGESPNKYWPN